MNDELQVVSIPDRLEIMRSATASKLEPNAHMDISVQEGKGDPKTYHFWVIQFEVPDIAANTCVIRGRTTPWVHVPSGHGETPLPSFRKAKEAVISWSVRDRNGALFFK